MNAAGEIVWEENTTGSGLIGPAYLVVDGVVVAAHDGLVGFRAQDGERLWAALESAPQVMTAAEQEGLFTTDGEDLVAVDILTGIERWRTPLADGGLVNLGSGAGLICAERLIFAPGDARVECFSSSDGSRRWVRFVGTAQWVAIARGLVILAGGEEEGEPGWIALNPDTGETVWVTSQDLPSLGPEISEGDVIYTCGDPSQTRRDCAAVRAEDGAVLWQRGLAGVPVSAPVLGGESLYVIVLLDDGRQVLFALERTTGSIRSQLDPGEEVRGFCANPETIGNLVFAFGCAGYLLAYEGAMI